MSQLITHHRAFDKDDPKSCAHFRHDLECSHDVPALFNQTLSEDVFFYLTNMCEGEDLRCDTHPDSYNFMTYFPCKKEQRRRFSYLESTFYR